MPAMNRLKYKIAVPLHVIMGTENQKQHAIEVVTARHAEALAVFRNLKSRNREGHIEGRFLQEYYCIGCDVPNGAMRAQIFGFAAYPLQQVIMQEVLGQQLTLQCYFPQTYETGAGTGPGGIIGTHPADAWQKPDVTASRSLKYWNWVDSSLPAYLPENEAKIALWKLSYIAFPQGKYWLANLPDTLPAEGISFPWELSHDLHALLGVPAMQRLITRHLGRDLLLLDASHIIERRHLSWGLLTN